MRGFFVLGRVNHGPVVTRTLTRVKCINTIYISFHRTLAVMRGGIPVKGINRLIRVPHTTLGGVLSTGPGVIAICSLRGTRRVDEIYARLNLRRGLVLQILKRGSVLCSNRCNKFALTRLRRAIRTVRGVPNIRMNNIYDFPYFLCSRTTKSVLPAPGLDAIRATTQVLAT